VQSGTQFYGFAGRSPYIDFFIAVVVSGNRNIGDSRPHPEDRNRNGFAISFFIPRIVLGGADRAHVSADRNYSGSQGIRANGRNPDIDAEVFLLQFGTVAIGSRLN
jgi:hypothetical protein